MSTHHKLHPLCSIFPPMSDEEFERLREDIAKHGQRQPILLYDGQILDGRHRHDACLLLKIQPKFETFTGTFDEAESLVLSLNLARRHLDTSQRGMVATRLANLDRGFSPNRSIDPLVVTQSEAASRLNVSVPTVKRAKYVNEHAAPEVIAEVDAGRMTINKAKKLIAALPDKHRQALAVKADAVDEMIAAHAAELQAAANRESGKPAWLADPDELNDATAPPPLPRTNTHHTPANRRTPDARETDLASVATAEEPYRHGGWYEWSEPRQRMILLDDYAICSRAEEINPPPPELSAVLARHNAEDILRVMLETRDARREKPEQVARLLKKIVGQLQDPEGAVVTAIAPPDEPKPGKLPTLSQLRKAIDTQAGWGEALRQAANDWAAYKMSLSGKEKVRSMDSWKKALVRMGNVAKSQSVSVVCEAIEKAIANGWTGWEHLDKLKHSPAQLRTQAAGTEDFGIEYEVVE